MDDEGMEDGYRWEVSQKDGKWEGVLSRANWEIAKVEGKTKEEAFDKISRELFKQSQVKK